MRVLALAVCLAALCAQSALADDYVTTTLIENEATEATDSINEALGDAAAAWSKTIRSEQDPLVLDKDVNLKEFCGVDYAIQADEEINNLLVLVQVVGESELLKDTGVFAQPCVFANADGTYFPRIGVITINAKLAAKYAYKGLLQTLVEHEIGHILGIGTLWTEHGLIEDNTYVGSRGIWGYILAGGPEDASSVPIERSADAIDVAHWDEDVFDTELMTGTMNARDMPLSTISVNSLRDLGYAVWPQHADEFDLLEDEDDDDEDDEDDDCGGRGRGRGGRGRHGDDEDEEDEEDDDDDDDRRGGRGHGGRGNRTRGDRARGNSTKGGRRGRGEGDDDDEERRGGRGGRGGHGDDDRRGRRGHRCGSGRGRGRGGDDDDNEDHHGHDHYGRGNSTRGGRGRGRGRGGDADDGADTEGHDHHGRGNSTRGGRGRGRGRGRGGDADDDRDTEGHYHHGRGNSTRGGRGRGGDDDDNEDHHGHDHHGHGNSTRGGRGRGRGRGGDGGDDDNGERHDSRGDRGNRERTTDLTKDYKPVDLSVPVAVYTEGTLRLETITITLSSVSDDSSTNGSSRHPSAWEIATTVTTIIFGLLLLVIAGIYVARMRQATSDADASSVGSEPVDAKIRMAQEMPQSATVV